MASGPHTARDAGEACKDCPEPPQQDAAGKPISRRCKVCARAHNAREAARRAERKRKHLCRVCGAKAVKSETGERLSTCAVHREYYRARAAP